MSTFFATNLCSKFEWVTGSIIYIVLSSSSEPKVSGSRRVKWCDESPFEGTTGHSQKAKFRKLKRSTTTTSGVCIGELGLTPEVVCRGSMRLPRTDMNRSSVPFGFHGPLLTGSSWES